MVVLAALVIFAIMFVTAGPSPLAGQDQQPPAKPTGLTGTVSHDQVSLTWDDPQDETITGYQVLRRDTSVHERGEFVPLVEDTATATTTYTDHTVEAGVRYLYRVKARNAGGLSVQSSFFQARVPQPPAVVVSFGQAVYSVGEGESVAVAVVLDTDPERDVSISIAASGGGGASDADYSVVPSEVAFAAGETAQTITVTATDDAEDDDGESVLLEIGTGLPDRVTAGSVNSTTVSITDNDEAEPVDPTDSDVAAQPTIYLTFDDGPVGVYTTAILDLLSDYDAQATFFVQGSRAARNPDLMYRMASEGHGIGNHTWTHERLTELNHEGFNAAVVRTQKILGEFATPCLRPPLGS